MESKKGSNSIPFLMILVKIHFIYSSPEAIQTLFFMLCALFFKAERLFFINDELPLPRARGRGRFLLE